MAPSDTAPLPRFHLMIGAACSGKSSAARILARCLQGPDQPPLRYICSGDIRQELYGDRSVLGRWDEVAAVIEEQLLAAIAAEEVVILEATYVKRCFRLAITQALPLPRPVQWIGWWLDTPVAVCLERNRQRAEPIPDTVIERQCAQLLESCPVPHRQEGFALVVRLQAEAMAGLEEQIPQELQRLEGCLQRGANRDAAYQLHGYSRLLDLERLLYLIRLLSRYPKLTATAEVEPEAEDGELERLLAPLPDGGLADQAAALLASLHGVCYGDAEAVAADLEWLDRNGFTARWQTAAAAAGRNAGSTPTLRLPPLQPPPWPDGPRRPTGGLPRLGDRDNFRQVLTLLRHLLHHPHDRQAGERISEHLASRLGGEDSSREVRTARQIHADLTEILTPYGFRLPGRSGRHGYALGTALLSLQELTTVAQLLEQQGQDLGDAVAAAIGRRLRRRLAGIEADRAVALPLRRWIQPTPPLPVSPAIDEAIRERQRLVIADVMAERLARRHGSRPRAVWPLQLLLHNGRWWLLHEHDPIGQAEGLLACLPLQRLHVFHGEQRPGRSRHQHDAALQRAELLRRHAGGVEFGDDLAAQLRWCGDGSALRPEDRVLLRFCCQPEVMVEIRRELDRFDQAAVRLSRPLPGDDWGRSDGPRQCLPWNDDPRHPYAVEIDLPGWVLRKDQELRRWLFAYGAALRLQGPEELVEEQRRWLAAAIDQCRGNGSAGLSIRAASDAAAADAAGESDPSGMALMLQPATARNRPRSALQHSPSQF